MTALLYTVGHPESYERGIDEEVAKGSHLLKLGIGPHPQNPGTVYLGGAVFRAVTDARAFAAAHGYTVYGLEGVDWDADTYQRPGEPFRRLLKDAAVTRLAHADEAQPPP